ncbi:zinc finger protein 675-like [Condylostylus longicornis]|uniref:zinc finger protein 675-like n=1 Tax=Condylostylus longicornis TaxID=2530218 RepID=UPI00244E125E|nr:zinc finger protein 675-like [Condylostylus longicornis]
MEKYGEVFLTSKTCFTLICTHCERATENYNEFLNHVLENHIDPLSCELKIEDCHSEHENPILNLQVEVLELNTDNDDSEEFIWKNSNMEVDKSFKIDDLENDFSDSEDSSYQHTDNALYGNYDSPIKNVLHCQTCNQPYYNLDVFERHKARNRCGYCPVCLVPIADVWAHVKNFHKDRYKDRKMLRQSVNEMKECRESENETEILLTIGKANSCNINTTIDKNENFEGSPSKHVNQEPNLQEESTEFKSDNESLEIYIEEVHSSDTEIDIKSKNNGYMNFLESEDPSHTCADNRINENDNPDDPVYCVYCGELFSPLYLKAHLKQYRCGKCTLCSSIVGNLYAHMTKDHKEYAEERKLLKQKIFERVPLSEAELLKKIEEKTRSENENQLKNIFVTKCIYCKKIFKSKPHYMKHMKRHEENNTCKYCGKRFLRFDRLKYHLRMHTDEKPYKCKFCSASFKDLEHVREHSRTRHTEGLNLKCTYENCDKVFKTKKRRKYHENYAHTSKYRRMCNDCGLIFLTSSRLNVHMKKKHTKYEDRKFSCTHCEKKFPFKSDLTDHERIHLGKKQFFCEICEKGFVTKKSFYKHKQYHKKKSVTDLKAN